MSFNLPMTPEDLPDYEYEAEVARLERHTEESDTAVTTWLGGRQARLDELTEED
jgi:hypothetical protein